MTLPSVAGAPWWVTLLLSALMCGTVLAQAVDSVSRLARSRAHQKARKRVRAPGEPGVEGKATGRIRARVARGHGRHRR